MNFENDIPYQIASAAHAGTSMVPEKRAEQERAGYSSGLAADYELFKTHAERGKTLHKLEEEFARYRSGLRKHYNAYLMSRSRCMSMMITGPSNFPVARMEKRNRIASSACERLTTFQETARKAVIRNLRPDLAPIMSGDDDALERLKAEITKLEAKQDLMKKANAVIRKHTKAGKDAQIAALAPLGFSAAMAAKLLEPDFCSRIGFPDFEITNNGANIRRLKKRLESVSTAKATPVEQKEGTNGVKLEDDPPENRVRLFFPGKPSFEVRERLKKNGFRWSPTSGAWQAYRNYGSLALAKELSGT